MNLYEVGAVLLATFLALLVSYLVFRRHLRKTHEEIRANIQKSGEETRANIKRIMSGEDKTQSSKQR